MTFHILPKRTDLIHPKYSDILYSLHDGNCTCIFVASFFLQSKFKKNISGIVSGCQTVSIQAPRVDLTAKVLK